MKMNLNRAFVGTAGAATLALALGAASHAGSDRRIDMNNVSVDMPSAVATVLESVPGNVI